MPSGIPPFKVLAGRYDFTEEAENLTYSNTDPGGHEVCTFDLHERRASLLTPGDPVRIMDGLTTVWQGRIAEPAKQIQRGWRIRHTTLPTTRVNAEGDGATLKDNTLSMIFVDQDLNNWLSWSVARQIVLVQAGDNVQQFSFQVAAAANGQPALVISSQGQIIGASLIEIYYDSGPINTVAEVYAVATPLGYVNPDAKNELFVADTADNSATNPQDTVNYGGGGSVTIDFLPAHLQRYIAIQHLYNQATNAFYGNANSQYGWSIGPVAVYGPHGLTKRGPAPSGFYTSDIALYAAVQAAGTSGKFRIGQVDTFPAYIVPHYIQQTPVPHDQIISDMAKLAPAHYGIWESDSIFDDKGVFTFRQYSTQPNRFTSLSECDEVDISDRLADLYTQAQITYQDAAGIQYLVTVSLPNAVLSRVGIRRTYQADIGLSSSAVAQAFANFALQALFAQARSAGSVQLSAPIRTINGAKTPAYRLKAGIDRLRIADLPPRQGSFLSSDSDGFHISRVEVNVLRSSTDQGIVQTRLEVDTGPTLLDTLTARLNIVSQLVGF